MSIVTQPDVRRAPDAGMLAAALRPHLEPLPSPERAEEFGAIFDRFSDANVILLGEATHGTSEFYRARSAITRRLIEKHGFTVVAVEADWPDAARIDAYVRHHATRPRRGESFVRFPTWMWRNVEVLEFADWLRRYNEGKLAERQASFHGLDVYSLSESMHAVISYLGRVDSQASERARYRYGCLSPWQEDPAKYGQAVVHGGLDPCETSVVQQLKEMLAKRLDWIEKDGEAWFDATLNARIVRAAERYYRSMYQGANESWNLRDRHMFDTLQAIIAHRGFGTKSVVWAHNSHVGNAAATAMGWRGQFNIGELARLAFGDGAVLVGFGTDTGTVAAASDWGADMEIKTVRPARADSYEHVFRRTGVSRSLTEWRSPGRSQIKEILQEPRLERAIGVVYRPETELYSHYFEAVLSEQFDCWVGVEQTSAVTPLGHEKPHGAPETYPFGL